MQSSIPNARLHYNPLQHKPTSLYFGCSFSHLVSFDLKNPLIHAHFFFVDIVGLSNPKTTTKSQIKKIETLNNCISECEIFQTTPASQRMLGTSGDGMWIGFLQGPDRPLLLAIQLHQKLAKYNKSKIPSEVLDVRIGLHSGICFTVKDIEGNADAWGPGIILARRVMDVGDENHILLSSRLAQDLIEISDEFSSILHPLNDYQVKHGVSVLIYSAYGKGFGNKENPLKIDTQESKMSQEILKLQRTTIYPRTEVSLDVLDIASMLVKHSRTYEVENIADEPIKFVLHGIGTDVEKKNLDDLKVKVFEKDGTACQLSSINMNKPFNKEFTTKFSEPILQDQCRQYTLEYQVEEPERYFENSFLTDCQEFVLKFSYPKTAKLSPTLFDVSQETEKKTKSTLIPKIKDDENKIICEWKKTNLKKGMAIRLEW